MQKKITAPSSRSIRLIGAASCCGASDRRCAAGPNILSIRGIDSTLAASGFDVAWEKIIRTAPGNTTPTQIITQVTELCEQLAQTTATLVKQDRLFIVLGGDHSCAIGTWSGATKALDNTGPLGLLWIDAHMDSHTPDTSPTGLLHGMPLAVLLGHGIKGLCSIARPGPKLLPQHVCLIGVRSYEHAEAALLQSAGVRIFFMEEIKQRGWKDIMVQALAIAKNQTAGYGVTIDLDAFDPVDAPGVGSQVQDGIPAQTLLDAFKKIDFTQDRQFIGVELAEFNPFCDIHDKTAQLTIELLRAIFG